ncbi:rod shape-determining protein MreC [Calorimonas adulescens]|uniref:Cell shape-determining protein MreC n=1 Tax=Calorimonas adulescens TaxID=2606906 RepID=A0A5D8QCW7_9THEO|nr:rod shape-determining protein MreC [Calorimonas adulescens]TZE82247.1 rod shape-determining protein MreC [Calorimonas adulescens]
MPWWEKYRDYLIIGSVVLSILILMGVSSSGKMSLSGLEFFSGNLIKPVSSTLYKIGNSISDFFYSLSNIGSLQSENERLRAKEEEYNDLRLQVEELKQENERLKNLLAYKETHQQYDMIGAKVIGKSSGGWFDIFAINVGRSSGVKEGMAVVTDKGIVGTVIESYDNWSKVLSIIDENSSVSIRINRTRDNGILQGDVELKAQGLARAVYIPMTSEVKPGDDVITSGLGGILPEGIYVGKVISVENSHGDLYKTAIIKPDADFQRLEDILVIKTYNDKIDLGKVGGQ